LLNENSISNKTAFANKRSDKPWKFIEGIEFRSETIVAYKGKKDVYSERNQVFIYKGSWKRVIDDKQVFRMRRVNGSATGLFKFMNKSLMQAISSPSRPHPGIN
jgi:hypothetical protein